MQHDNAKEKKIEREKGGGEKTQETFLRYR
jgi:hypothetical protein